MSPKKKQAEARIQRQLEHLTALSAIDRVVAGNFDLELSDVADNLFLTTLFTEDGFVCYYGMPLITKGQVKGVPEVFHRAALEPEAEWFDFLNALAGQAAIAIENALLFESLQRSNSELNQAYDATIEGWSRALDLRDNETEGHTQRVAEMTVKLARAFDLSEVELVQVRWVFDRTMYIVTFSLGVAVIPL